jgi:hypothetical protein
VTSDGEPGRSQPREPLAGSSSWPGLCYAVAVRARSRTPAVVPTYMSRVVRTLACPAMQDTSVASSFQVNRAVTQNTYRRLCQVQVQVQVPLPPVSRHPAAR